MKRQFRRKLILCLFMIVAVCLWFGNSIGHLCVPIKRTLACLATSRPCCVERTDMQFVQRHVTKLERKSSIVEDLSFPVTCRACRDISHGDNRVWLLIAVISKASHFEARNAIRQTWGSEANPYNDKRVCLVFITGRTDPSYSPEINQEIHQYGDIVQINKEDTYKNVVFKSIAMLKWAHLYVKNVQFVIKLDDDVYLQMAGLLRILSSFHCQSRFIMGHLEVNAKAIRNTSSRYYISSSEYSGEVFPHYMRGGSYLISGDLIQDLLSVIPRIPLVSLEDVYITGICAAYVSAHHIYNCGFNSEFSLRDRKGMHPHAVTVYEYGPESISQIWSLSQNMVYST